MDHEGTHEFVLEDYERPDAANYPPKSMLELGWSYIDGDLDWDDMGELTIKIDHDWMHGKVLALHVLDEEIIQKEIRKALMDLLPPTMHFHANGRPVEL